MDLKDVMGKVAPWLAAAAAGPAGLAGMAVKTIAEVLGAPADGDLTAALAGATPEQLKALKLADLDFKLKMQELGFKQVTDLEAIAAGDRKDARAMQSASRSRVPALLSFIVTLGYFGVLAGMLAGWLKASDSQALLLMLGSLSTAWGMVMAFWFGTTSDSGRKTDLLAKAQPIQ